MSETQRPKILLLNFSRIGDVVSSLVVAELLRDRHGEVDFLLDPNFFSLLETEPGIHPVTAEQALAGRYDLLVDLTSGKDSRRFVRKVHARTKVGLYRTWHHRIRLMATYNVLRKKKVIRGSTEQDHIVKGFYPVLRYFGCAEPLIPTLHAGRATPAVEQLLAEARRDGRRVVSLHFGATNPKRRPPTPWLASLIEALKARGLSVILLGDEHALREELLQATDRYPLVFEGDLNELKYLLSRSDLFIGPCSGPLHVAAALGIPSIGLYGPTVPRISAPLSPSLRIVELDLPCRPCLPNSPCEHDVACLAQLPLERVTDEVDKILSQSATTP